MGLNIPTLLFLGVTQTPNIISDQEGIFVQVIAKVRELLRRGLIEDAIFLSVNNLNKTDERHRLFHLIGDAFFKKEMFSLSRDFYGLALEEGSNTPWTYFNMARSLDKLNDNECIQWFDKAISISKNPEFLYGKAVCKIIDIPEKKHLFKEAVSRDKSILFRDWGLQSAYPKKMRGDLYEIMSEGRNNSWFRPNSKEYNPKFGSFARLVEKSFAQEVAIFAGLNTPQVYAKGNLDELSSDLDRKKYVLKPLVGASSKGVLLVSDGVDLLSGKSIGPSVKEFYDSTGFQWHGTKFLVEEFCVDVEAGIDPRLTVPRDFKCFAANGKLYWVNVYDRNYSTSKEMTVGCYDDGWKRLPNTSEHYKDSGPLNKPEYFNVMKEQVCRLSSLFPYFMRFDFYITNKGPVFGEFTHNPSEGRYQTRFGERTQLQLLFIYPDPKDPNHDRSILNAASQSIKLRVGSGS